MERISKTSKTINYEMEKSCTKVDWMIFPNKKDQTRVKRIYKASKIVTNETGKSYMKINRMSFRKKKKKSNPRNTNS